MYRFDCSKVKKIIICNNIYLVHDPLSSLTYPRIPHTPHVASNLPIKTLVARQRPTNIYYYLGNNLILLFVGRCLGTKVFIGKLPAT